MPLVVTMTTVLVTSAVLRTLVLVCTCMYVVFEYGTIPHAATAVRDAVYLRPPKTSTEPAMSTDGLVQCKLPKVDC